MTSIDNVLIQVRARLKQEQIKLWDIPYYLDDHGPIESEMEVSATNRTVL